MISCMSLGCFLRRFFDKRAKRGEVDAQMEPEAESGSIDAMNPFPEPVVIEFRDVIDLHSVPPHQVRVIVGEYLEEAHSRGIRWVRIIHGKGVGVQREMVHSILARTEYVEDFGDAPPEAGGWGATVVTLRTADTDGKSSV
ncbi:MAG TPA: Smr/MutS family protein [Blastocatellia bacterium]|nr:Smr/MutS family protein [Blastocatellia bacterium]